MRTPTGQHQMENNLYLILLTILIGYMTGIVFCNKPFSLLLRLVKNFSLIIGSIKNFCRSQVDKLFILLAFAISFGIPFSFYRYFNSQSPNRLSESVEMGVFLATFFGLTYSVLIKGEASKYKNRPIIKADFDKTKTEYFHKTTMKISYDILTPQYSHQIVSRADYFLPALYVRLKIINKGKTTLRNTEVVVEGVTTTGELTHPFIPLNLHWSFAESGQEWKIDIPPHGSYRFIDLLEVTEPQKMSGFTQSVSNLGKIDKERYSDLRESFRLCTIPPYTSSDIFKKGDYVFYVSIKADNAVPITRKVMVAYDANWDDNISLEEMYSQHLKVELRD